jgi:hypothetical protein
VREKAEAKSMTNLQTMDAGSRTLVWHAQAHNLRETGQADDPRDHELAFRKWLISNAEAHQARP